MLEDEIRDEVASPFEEDVEQINVLFAPIRAMLKGMLSRYEPAENLIEVFKEKHVWKSTSDRVMGDEKLQFLNAIISFTGRRPLDEGTSLDSLVDDFPQLTELETSLNNFDPTLLPFLRSEVVKMDALCEAARTIILEKVKKLGADIKSKANYKEAFIYSFESSSSYIDGSLSTIETPIAFEIDTPWDIFLAAL